MKNLKSVFYALLLLAAPFAANAAATIDTGNIAHGLFSVSNTTFNLTCGGSDNILVVMEANSSASASQAPSTVTYNGVSMTLVTGSSKTVSALGHFEVSMWYLVSPPTGTSYAVVVNYTTTPQFGGATGVPMSGVNTTSPFGTVTGATSTANNNAAVTATGAGSSDLYLANALNGTGTMTAAGANQTNLVAQNGNGGGSNASMTYDTVPGIDAGVFSWTPSGTVWGNGWVAAGVAVFGTTGSCTHSGYSSGGAIAIPNGTTGSYVGKSGAFVTPDCATINYWSPSQGNFGTN